MNQRRVAFLLDALATSFPESATVRDCGCESGNQKWTTKRGLVEESLADVTGQPFEKMSEDELGALLKYVDVAKVDRALQALENVDDLESSVRWDKEYGQDSFIQATGLL